MILDMVWDRDRTYMFTGSVDMTARSWMPELGDEVRMFEGAPRSVTIVKAQGEIRKGGRRVGGRGRRKGGVVGWRMP